MAISGSAPGEVRSRKVLSSTDEEAGGDLRDDDDGEDDRESGNLKSPAPPHVLLTSPPQRTIL